MALSGAHIACVYVGALGSLHSSHSLTAGIAWSETMANAGTTSRAAASSDEYTGSPCFEITASVDIYVAIGKSPVASNVSGDGAQGRIFVRANETRNLFCNPGDKLAWVAA